MLTIDSRGEEGWGRGYHSPLLGHLKSQGVKTLTLQLTNIGRGNMHGN